MVLRIICNGIPKSGTHALVKTVELLGIPWVQEGCAGPHCIHGHFPASDPPPEGRHILIVRQPRNILVSWCRFTRSTVTDGFLMAVMRKFWEGGAFYDAVVDFAGHTQNPDVLTIRFEDLLGNSNTVVQIAGFIGVPVLPDTFENIPGLTQTYTGRLSNWRKHWNDRVEAAWVEHGGPEAERVFGYADRF